MCEIYVKADPIHYELRTRSIRVHGVVTSIRLENMCWDVLARIARKDSQSTNQLISQLYDEVICHQGKVSNFCSFLRVSCMHYLSNLAARENTTSLLQENADDSVALPVPKPPSRHRPMASELVLLQVAGQRSCSQ
ncbi:ribbon-helix-helix domain-containing protein [Actimicrobium antarcticum]|uniref:Ribbon-helix-helix domain-containing protein n=1 Tax=Actimicrobium antarcticum TaxID=1051899 RepID=A0ABP7SKZ7_9BURK